MQLELEREELRTRLAEQEAELRTRLAEQEAELSRQSQELHQSRLDRSRYTGGGTDPLGPHPLTSSP